ncbi:MAG: T9SS type A sorting domain-containing protein [Bacteroidetes bacterium]|nr:T9SS type A sorting domain-containing protein [Bacteroidota bacterium]
MSYSPNPFKEDITIRYKVNKTSNVRIDLTDIYGRVVKEFINTHQSVGTYNLTQVIDELNQGVYLLRIQDGEQTQAKLLLKY